MDYVSVERPEPGIAIVTVDRAAKRNALSIRVRDEMSDALDALADDPDVRVVVIASTGPIFSAGFDLKEFADESVSDELWASSSRWHDRLRSFPLPLIASVQGPALAGGFDLATMCDLRVAARSATFSRPERTWTTAIYSILHELVGGAAARELTLTSRSLDAEEAQRIGLVTLVVDDDELASATLALAADVAQAPREILTTAKAKIIHAAKTANDADFAW